MWGIPLKNKIKPITDEFSNVLSKSKQRPLKLESDRGSEWYNSIFQNFLRSKNIQHYSGFTDKGPSIAERVNRTIRNLIKKPIFLARNANWLSELPSIVKQYNNILHHSIKMTPVQASKKSNENLISNNLRDKIEFQKPKFKLCQKVRTSVIRKVFSIGDSTNYSYISYTIPEVIDDTIPSYRIEYLPERYNENLLLPTKLSLEQNNQVMENLILFQKK